MRSRSSSALGVAALLLVILIVAVWMNPENGTESTTTSDPRPTRYRDRAVSTWDPSSDPAALSSSSDPAQPAESAKEGVSEIAIIPSPTPGTAWTLVADRQPVSHWAPGTGGAPPQRSGKLDGGIVGIENAKAGSPVEFPLFDGQVARGTVRKTTEPEPGVRIWSGRLTSPKGSFFIEHNESGWRGTLKLKDESIAYRIFPGLPGNEGPWIERWAQEEVECAQLTDSSYDPDSPAVDPNLVWSELQSRPGAPRVIYLDFNGGTVSNTYWNSEYNEDNPINYANSGLSGEDRIRAWFHAADDFRAFNVNVTTSLAAYQAAPSSQRILVPITPTKSWYGDDPDEEVTAKGGVSEVGSFGSAGSVAWVWNLSWLSAGDTISHEAGHALGLRHSGFFDTEAGKVRSYYHGHGDGNDGWAPIMGYGADDSRYLTTWDNGSYPLSNNDQDQKAILTVFLQAVGDDHGNSTSTATTLPAQGTGPVFEGSGQLETSSDVDYFRLQLTENVWVIEAIGNPYGKNVNLTIQVRNPQNVAVYEADLSDSTDSLAVDALGPGTYYVTIRSTTFPETDDNPGYPRYGQLGSYSLTVKPLLFEETPPVARIHSVTGLTLGSSHVDVVVKYTDGRGIDRDTLGDTDVYKNVNSSGLSTHGEFLSHTGTNRELYATYRFMAPGGEFDVAEGGTYQFYVPAGAIKDLNGNANAASATHTATLPNVDNAAPTIGLPDGLGNASNGDTSYAFRISIDDISPVAVTSSGLGCVEVRRVSAGDTPFASIPVTATWAGVSSANYNKNWLIDYTFTPPGGVWDDTDVGEYQIWLRSNKVWDDSNNYAPAQKIGSFYLRKRLWLRTFDESGLVALFTRDSGWSEGEPQGTGGYRNDPAAAYDGDRILGYRLGSGDSALYQNNITTTRYATSPAINVTGYSRISLQFARWLTLEAGDKAVIQASRNGGSWTTIWRSPEDTAVMDSSWKVQEVAIPVDIGDNASALRFRFGIGPTDGESNAGGWNLDNIKIIAASQFNPGRIILNNVLSSVTEGATFSAYYTVRLDQAPGSPVTIEIDPGTQLETSRSSITFTAANYSTPVNVLLTAKDDIAFEGDHFGALTHRAAESTTDPAFTGVATYSLIRVNDDENALIATHPTDKSAAPGQSAVFSVVPISTSLKSYQWYQGTRGDTSNPLSGETLSYTSFTLPAGTSQPIPIWVRVRHSITNVREDSNVAYLHPLSGYAAWKSLLKSHGYTNADLEAPGFDDADPDRDGLSHFMEYAFGGQPYTQDRGRLPTMTMERAADAGGKGGQLEMVITFGAPKLGVRYITETCTDLRTWRAYKTTTSPTIPIRGAATESVIRIPNSGQKGFARMKVESTSGG